MTKPAKKVPDLRGNYGEAFDYSEPRRNSQRQQEQNRPSEAEEAVKREQQMAQSLQM